MRSQSLSLPFSPRRFAAAAFGGLMTVALLSLGALAFWLAGPNTEMPSAWNPYAPLALDDPLTPVQRWKIAEARQDFAACQAALREGGATLVERADHRESDFCSRIEMVGMTRLASARLKPVDAKCSIALSLALWEARELQPAAEALFGEPVAEILHLGSYNCRKIAGSSWWSQHATANAIDISGFRLKSGREISIEKDWDSKDENAAAFLRAARDGACSAFNAVLGPDYNAAHHDHFHVDLGWWRTCR